MSEWFRTLTGHARECGPCRMTYATSWSQLPSCQEMPLLLVVEDSTYERCMTALTVETRILGE